LIVTLSDYSEISFTFQLGIM